MTAAHTLAQFASAVETLPATKPIIIKHEKGRAVNIQSALAAFAKPASAEIVFQNPGLIDLAAITTMGVSVKEGDSPIGYFGTGLKFAIATILRHGGSMTLYRGVDAYVFGVEAGQVRGQDFDFVTMNGERLGFTTQLGRKWEPWMAFRELASNCRDEGGCHFSGEAVPSSGHTTIVVSGGAMLDVWTERGSVMLESPPLAVNEHIEVHEGPSLYAFYRGVRVHRLSRPSALTYNMLSALPLTEDRTPANYWKLEYAIECGIGALEDERLLRKALTAGPMCFEHELNLGVYGTPSAAFRAIARELSMGRETVPNANPKAVSKARETALMDMQPGDAVELESHQRKMLVRAKQLLAAGGFEIDDFPLIVTDTLGPNICGMAKDGKIFMSLLPFRKGTREVATTLLEEYAHLRSGADDATREFQNWLFDQLLVQTERAAGEPF